MEYRLGRLVGPVVGHRLVGPECSVSVGGPVGWGAWGAPVVAATPIGWGMMPTVIEQQDAPPVAPAPTRAADVVLLHVTRGIFSLRAGVQPRVDPGDASVDTAGGPPGRSGDLIVPTRLRLSAIAVAMTVLVAGCATVPPGPRVAVMPGPQKSMPQFRDDQLACQDFAQASLGGWTPNDAAANSAAASAAVGTLLGAAAGAILGSVSGQAGQGAAWGAGTGLLFGSAAGVNAAGYSQQETQRRYDVAYVQCMWSRGNSVPGPVAFRAGPSQAAPAIPPPNTPPPSGLASGAPSSRIPAPPMTPPRGTIAPPGTAPGVPPGAIAPGPPVSVVPPADSPPQGIPPPNTPPPPGLN